MERVVVDKDRCREVGLELRRYSLQYPKRLKERINPEDLEASLFHIFIVSGICHQINWDFLMEALKQVQRVYPLKFTPLYMSEISDEEVYAWLSGYSKKWRLNKRFRRGELIRNMSEVLLQKHGGKVVRLLEMSCHMMGGETGFYNLLKDFEAYGEDPLCKKSAVFIDFVDWLGLWSFNDWQNYIPPIDYHITRVALRSGVADIRDPELLTKVREGIPVTEREDFIIRSAAIGALRRLAEASGKHPRDFQGFFWVIGRECCDPEEPHCFSCKLKDFCGAERYMDISCGGSCILNSVCKSAGNKELLAIKEHNFETTFY